jgi:hypothetical protein
VVRVSEEEKFKRVRGAAPSDFKGVGSDVGVLGTLGMRIPVVFGAGRMGVGRSRWRACEHVVLMHQWGGCQQKACEAATARLVP